MTILAWLHRPAPWRKEVVDHVIFRLLCQETKLVSLVVLAFYVSSVLWSPAALNPDPTQFAYGGWVRR